MISIPLGAIKATKRKTNVSFFQISIPLGAIKALRL